ncbi:MAG TPA: hypothetical protein VGH19_23100 [Verrucomicrobiae bacterium]
MTQLNQPSLFEADSWFPHSRPVLLLQEVADAFVISTRAVRDLVDEGVLVAAGVHSHATPGRVHLRIERWSVIAWRLNLLAEQGQQLPFKESPQVTWWRAELLKRPKLAPCTPGRKLTATTTPMKKARKKKCTTKKSPRAISSESLDDPTR